MKGGGYDSTEAVRLAGGNTGNYVFVDALKEQLNYSVELDCGINHDFELIDGKKCRGIISAANNINLHDNTLLKLRDLIVKTPFPVTLAGWGVQTTGEYNTVGKFMEVVPVSLVKAIKEIAERAVSIGIRGEFTAEYLEKIHVHNYRIIGCPSAYSVENPAVWEERRKGQLRIKLDHVKKGKCVFNVNPGMDWSSIILKIGMESHAEWIMQTAHELPETKYDGKRIEKRHLDRYPGLLQDTSELEHYIMEHAHLFGNIVEWKEYLKNNDFVFSFGSRFHGNMLAFQCGIPALWITHDSRTSELVETMKLPCMECGGLTRIKSVEQLAEICDYSPFFKNYRSKRKEYVKFLEENGLDNNNFT